jgi:hypothetical protein
MFKKLIVLIVMVLCITAQGEITNRYSFIGGESVAIDTVGGKDGTFEGNATVSGGRLILDGSSRVVLPSDTLDPAITSLSVECWVEIATAATWSRAWDFGASDGGNGGYTIYFVPYANGNSRFTMGTNGFPSWQTGEETALTGELETGVEAHIVCVFDGSVPELRYYKDGVLVDSLVTTMDLAAVARENAFIGSSSYPGDPWFTGAIDDFRIYNHAMTDVEVSNSYLAGPDAGACDLRLFFEAENADSITAPMETYTDDPLASGGAYIGVAQGNNSTGASPAPDGTASYNFIVGETGTYKVAARMKILNSSYDDDSCWFRIDGATQNSGSGWVKMNGLADGYLLGGANTGNWKWITAYNDDDGRVQVEFTLDPGSYTLEVAYREDGMYFDGFLVTDNLDIDTSGLPDEIPGSCDMPTASKPKPGNNAVEVPRDVILSWNPGSSSDSRNVYFGADAALVEAGDASVLVAEGLTDIFLAVGTLPYGSTHYWRVDEVNSLDMTVNPGPVWNFTIEAVGYEIPANLITVSASSASEGQGPENTINGSGLTDGMHSTDGLASWLSESSDPGTAWIQYDFDKAYKLSQMRIWNFNGPLILSGLGIKDVNIEYSLDGTTWSVLDAVTELASASGTEDYEGELFNIDIAAMSVKITGNSTQGGAMFNQYGLSEVKFFMSPVRASNPVPASGTADLDMQQTLGWKPGRGADEHHVYISTDEQAVIDMTAPVTVLTDPSLDVLLSLTNTYYWTVVEVNNNNDPAAWTTDVWNFSSLDYYVIDDFEADDLAWGDSGGASVELSTDVARDNQSMKLDFDNDFSDGYSEATLSKNQNLTKGDPTALVFWVYGDLDNDVLTEQMYVRISYPSTQWRQVFPWWGYWQNIEQSAYFKDVVATSELETPWWTQVTVSLEDETVADWANVQSINIGLQRAGLTAGSGTLYIDDVRLYGTPPVPPVPTDPGTGNLVAYYAMENDVTDSSGNGYDGTAIGEPNYGPGFVGSAMEMDGSDDNVELPIGPAISTMTDMTISTWVNWNGDNIWQRICDFGNGTPTYIFICPRVNTGQLRVAIKVDNSAEQVAQAPFGVPMGSWCHIAAVINATDMTMSLYFNGELVGIREGLTLLPMDMGDTPQNYIGKSQWPDPLFNGSVDEFRIYDAALTADEVRFLADPTP